MTRLPNAEWAEVAERKLRDCLRSVWFIETAEQRPRRVTAYPRRRR